nr:uncharacterized protein LOC113816263 [Penaeus vannamei]
MVCETLNAALESIGERARTRQNFILLETLEVCRAQTLLRRDKEQFIKNLAEEENTSRLCILKEEGHSVVSLDASDVAIPVLDPPVSEEPPTLTEVRVKDRKTAGICDSLLNCKRLGMSLWHEAYCPDCHQAVRQSFPHNLLKWIHNPLLRHQRHGKSTIDYECHIIDRFLALRVTVKSSSTTRPWLCRRYFDSESLESLVAVLDALSNEAKPLGLQVSRTKTRIQDFGAMILPVLLYGSETWTPSSDAFCNKSMTATSGYMEEAYGKT